MWEEYSARNEIRTGQVREFADTYALISCWAHGRYAYPNVFPSI